MIQIRFVVLVFGFSINFPFPVHSAISQIRPEFKEAAQKRQAELARQMFCNERAVKQNILKRDVASFVVRCMDNLERAEQAAKDSRR